MRTSLTFVLLPETKFVLVPEIVTVKFCPIEALLGVTETNCCEKKEIDTREKFTSSNKCFMCGILLMCAANIPVI